MHRRPPLPGRQAPGPEELGGDLQAVGGGEAHRFGLHQGGRGEVGGDGALRHLARRRLAAES